MKSLHIFRAGTHTDQGGRTVTLSEADVAASAAAYDPALHEAPIVVGHPRTDAPAYGWVASASANGQDLSATPAQVDPAFSEMVQAGRFKKISTSFYAPDAPGNPKPGVWYIKHVGFLGAQPPAVKGLRSVAFADGEAGVVEFSDWALSSQASLWRRVREWLIAQFGQETADQVVPGYEVEFLRDQAQQPDPAPASTSPAFADPPQPEPTVTQEEIARLQADNARLQREAAQRAAAERHAASVAFAEARIAAGTLKPKHKDAVIGILDFAEAPPDERGSVSFGEADSMGAAFRALLEDMPAVVSFGEQASADRVKLPDNKNPLIADAEARAQAAR